ncbi:MAG TPA: CYTH domain-containing protein [Candidatus Paceibacterota bacterium]|nr:CYTH domain-containing protein [Candidatus Paceibacterota bacterium]
MKEDSYEIEIKCLLGDRAQAERLRQKMKELDPALASIGSHRQLNHYFEGKGDLRAVARAITDEDDRASFLELAGRAKDFSLRTRDADGKVLLVMKASIDDTTSANGTARQEFESEVAMPIDDLDKIILDAGFTYQAKWSRERQEYKFSGANVTIDKNAGYGYLAEFEMIESDPSKADAVKARLRKLIEDVGLHELDQARLARMFDHYNAHWPEYYGTEKIFVVE